MRVNRMRMNSRSRVEGGHHRHHFGYPLSIRDAARRNLTQTGNQGATLRGLRADSWHGSIQVMAAMVRSARGQSKGVGRWAVWLLLALTAVATSAAAAVTPEERELIARANEMELDLAQRGLLFTEPPVHDYVAAVGARVAATVVSPPQPLRFQVLRDPIPNAFALPSGGIYITLGLLARLENEAQMALILGHEAAHITHHHALQR